MFSQKKKKLFHKDTKQFSFEKTCLLIVHMISDHLQQCCATNKKEKKKENMPAHRAYDFGSPPTVL
jgi:hypothetical protein